MILWKDIKCNKYIRIVLLMTTFILQVLITVQSFTASSKILLELIILNFSTFHKELTVHLTDHAKEWVITIHPQVTWSWNFVRICLNKFYAHTKSIKNAAFENFKLFPENQPSNKTGSNNDKQIKLYEMDGE